MLSAFPAVFLFSAAAYGADGGPVGTVSSVLTATSEPGATVAQTTLGGAAADAARQLTGADIAILNGGDFYGNLQPGEVSEKDIEAVFLEDRYLAVTTVTCGELRGILEHGVGAITVSDNETIDRDASSDGRFPQISGFTFTYDASAPAGSRVVSILNEQGRELDGSAALTLAATAHMLSGGYGYDEISGYRLSDISLPAALGAYIAQLGTLDEPSADRITVIGVRDAPIMGGVSFGVIAIVLIVFVLFVAKSKTMNFEVRRDGESAGADKEA